MRVEAAVVDVAVDRVQHAACVGIRSNGGHGLTAFLGLDARSGRVDKASLRTWREDNVVLEFWLVEIPNVNCCRWRLV